MTSKARPFGGSEPTPPEIDLLRARVAELEQELVWFRSGEDRFPNVELGHLMEGAPVGFGLLDPDLRYQVVNSKLAEMHGVPASSLIGRTMDEVAPHFGARTRALQQALDTGRPVLDHEFSAEVPNEPGRQRYWSESCYPIRAANGRLIGAGTVVTDITQRHQVLEALRSNQERLQLAQAVGGIGSWDWDLLANEVRCSAEYGPLYGLPSSDRAPDFENWLKLVHPDDRAQIMANAQRAFGGADEHAAEYRVIWPDQSVHWLFSKGRVFRNSEGAPTRVIGVDMDITERKHVEQALRDRGEQFRKMADEAPVMICASGPDQKATFFNRGWLSFTGRTPEQELGAGWIEGIHPDDRERALAEIRACIEAGRYCHTEYRLRRADGEYRWILCSGEPRFEADGSFGGYAASAMDITDLKRSHQLALARQRLEGIGVAAGSIAHDFNNLLASILADSELLELEMPAESPARESIERIKHVSARAAEIVRQLLAYSGRESTVFEAIDLSALVSEMLQFLKVLIAKSAALEVDLAADLPAVWGNASEIRQVVLNLVTNASEACRESHGAITVATSCIRVSHAGKNPAPHLPDGEYLRLTVADTGCGMTESVLARIFEPFFTTKFTGRGMGLAAVQEIVRRHSGDIDVVSKPGEGARFEILLPSMGRPAPVESASPTLAATKTADSLGTVLIVEDEVALRTPVSKMLRRAGYSVFEAGDGPAALRLFRSNVNDIEVVLLDMTLPVMSGAAILREIRRIRPQVKVILTTAYSYEKVRSELGEEESWTFLRKPYQFAELLALMQRSDPEIPAGPAR